KRVSWLRPLHLHLDRLLRSLRDAGLQPPSQDFRIVELPQEGLGRFSTHRDALHTPSDYAIRFNELLRAGYRWINLSCYGVYDVHLIVAVELPGVDDQSPLMPGRHTAVNLSGPARIVLEQNWEVWP